MFVTVEELQEQYPAGCAPSKRWLIAKATEYGIAEQVGRETYIDRDFMQVHLTGEVPPKAPAPGSWDNPSGWVYFIASPCHRYVKIGCSRNAERRLKRLQVSHYGKLYLIVAIEGNTVLEADLHERFREHRTNGEWFLMTPEIESFIKDARRKQLATL